MKKSTIAKLLAEEDISVVHKKTKTASFDVKKRELVLPIFKEEISNDVYDMFVCHEVGHSLWTPLDMLEQVHKHGIDKSVVNVIEDARIEAMIQNRYPGSRKNFTQGYKELLQRDFFGINKKDITKLNIIDKINIFFKTGLDVGFTDTEQKLADKVAKCKTPEDVLALAVEIAGYHKQKSEEEKQSELKINIPNNAPKDENEESDDTTDSSGSDELDIQEDDTEEDNNDSAPADQEANDNQEEESTGEKQNNGAGNGAGLGQDRIKKSDLVAHTDGAYQSAMNEHNDTEANNREYVNIPKKFHLSKLIINYKTVLADLDNHYKGSETEWFDNEYTKLVNDNKKIVQYMVKEFEMKKQADLYKRATVSKTGVLNMSKLHTYKYNDDLFAKMTTIPGATNHGMVMYVDWSGSMADNMSFTLKQLYNLIWFCNRTKIPFQVLGFTDRDHRRGVDSDKDRPVVQDVVLGDACIEETKLIEWFSSNMTKLEQEKMIKHLMKMTYSWIGYRANRDMPYLNVEYVMDKYNLGGTPLNHAILCAADVIENFQEKTRVQKTNVIFLTDGDSHSAEYYYDYPSEKNSYLGDGIHAVSTNYDSDIVYKDKKRYITHINAKGQYYSRINQTKNLLELLKKQVPDINIVGFFIDGRGKHGRVNVDNMCRKMGWSRGRDEQKILDAQKQLKKEKVLVCKSQGYDEYYILPRGPIDSAEDEVLEIKEGAKPNQIARAFMKSSGSKTVNRQLLNKFIKMVA